MINYKDLIPGNTYKGVITGCDSKPIWIFKYTPPKIKKESSGNNVMYHKGLTYRYDTKKLTKEWELWTFDRGWEFSEATEEEKALLQLKYEYEIY